MLWCLWTKAYSVCSLRKAMRCPKSDSYFALFQLEKVALFYSYFPPETGVEKSFHQASKGEITFLVQPCLSYKASTVA